MSTTKNDCSILRWLDPQYAAVVEPACAAHDVAYKHRLGQRLIADLQWVSRAAELSGRPIKSLFYGVFLMLGGWWLWRDYDRKLMEALRAAFNR